MTALGLMHASCVTNRATHAQPNLSNTEEQSEAPDANTKHECGSSQDSTAKSRLQATTTARNVQEAAKLRSLIQALMS
jgi:hypothetical protein